MGKLWHPHKKIRIAHSPAASAYLQHFEMRYTEWMEVNSEWL